MRQLLTVLLLAIAASACRGADSAGLPTGSPAPDFSLPGADGKTYALRDFANSPVLVVLFTGNTCPTSQLYESRVRKLHEAYRDKGVAVVAINPNKPEHVQLADLAFSDVGESLADMKIRAEHRGLPYPYLSDGAAQAVTKQFGVNTVPHVFVFDQTRALRYQGRIDDDVREEGVKSHYARDAVDALLAGKPAPTERTGTQGCPVQGLTTPVPPDQQLAAFEQRQVTVDMVGAEDLKELRQNPTDKLLMVNFWATWCAPCVTEFPELEKTYRMYQPRGLEFIPVSVNDPEERPAVVEFLERHHASHPNKLFGSSDVYGLQAAFDPNMPAPVPFTVLLAPNGDVLYQELGEADIPKLRRAILAHLPDDPRFPGLKRYWENP